VSQPLVGAIATYFVVNSTLMAWAMGLSTRQSAWRIWHEKFLWSAPSFIVAGTAGAIAAMMVERGTFWLAVLLLAPLYLTYRTYHVFLGRIADQQRHFEDERRHHEETQRLHREAVAALAATERAEQALADKHEHLSVTLRSIGDGVITTDTDGTIVMINGAGEMLTGWTDREAVGRPLGTIFRNLDRQTRERCDNSLERLGDHPDRSRPARHSVLVTRDLTERPIEESASPLRDAGGRTIGMVVVFRDISDALKAQEEQARADKLSSLGLLAGGIAHDFNNILMSIMNSVSVARAETPSAGSAAAMLRDATSACEQARQLTWQLLTFSKGGIPVKKPVSLPRLLQESATLSLRGSNVTCELQISPDLWSLNADEGQLVRVFHNLIINAQQAMPQGGVIKIRAQNVAGPERSAAPHVRVSFIDSGIGIPPEHLCSIFDPYFSTKQNGRGLGLATAHSIVKNHGGSITVESTPREGATVHVNLPARLKHGDDARLEFGGPPRPGLAGTGRILVMDDEAAVRALAVNMLEFLGYDGEGASSGADALDCYKRALAAGRPFDAVILDYVVPDGMGGDEVIVELASIDPAVVAILLSGYGQHPVMAEFRERGFKAVIVKPLTLEELSRTLHAVLAPSTSTVH
jgi:PAS domain S-box-containing protein